MRIGHLKGALLSVLMIASLMVILLLAPLKAAGFSGSGSGTAGDPYIITTVEQLQEMKNDTSAHYALGNDIDASDTVNWNDGAGFEPIGFCENSSEDARFAGVFDGRRYKISNLYINRTTNYVGLFGVIDSGCVVENMGLENENVNGNGFVGGLVGYSPEGMVSNCYSTGSVSGGDYVGGLVGYNMEGTVSNSYSTGSVSGVYRVSGLVGGNEGILSNSYATGSVSGENMVGGLVGHNDWVVSNCYSTGSVSGGDYVGGLVGNCDIGATVSNSFWDNETSGWATSDGGTGKTTENMKNARTFTDNTWSVGLTAPWDFVENPYGDAGNEDIWDINPDVNDGYPFLAALAPPGEGTPNPNGPIPTRWPLIAGVVGVIVVIGIVAALCMRRR